MNLVVFLGEPTLVAVEFICVRVRCRCRTGQRTVCFNVTAEEAAVPSVVRCIRAVSDTG